jgi:hypothetical protein
MFVQQLLAGMNAKPPHSEPYLRLFARYTMGEPGKEGVTETGPGRGMQIVFMGPPRDPMAEPGDRPRPLRLLGQIRGPNGDIIDAKTGRVIVPAAAAAPLPTTGGPSEGEERAKADDVLGSGEDRLEMAEDRPSQCLACAGRGWRPAGPRLERRKCGLSGTGPRLIPPFAVCLCPGQGGSGCAIFTLRRRSSYDSFGEVVLSTSESRIATSGKDSQEQALDLCTCHRWSDRSELV